jgi:hypothetical protein
MAFSSDRGRRNNRATSAGNIMPAAMDTQNSEFCVKCFKEPTHSLSRTCEKIHEDFKSLSYCSSTCDKAINFLFVRIITENRFFLFFFISGLSQFNNEFLDSLDRGSAYPKPATYTRQLTLWNRVLLAKLIVVQLVKKFFLLLQNSKVHHRFDKDPPLDPISSQMYAVYNLVRFFLYDPF